MPHPQESDLLTRLPPEARDALQAALGHADPKSSEAGKHVVAALKAVAFPEGKLYPLPESLNAAQRVVAEVLAYRETLNVYPFPMPGGALRKRWLGLESGGVLESERVTVDGAQVPLWRGLQLAGFDYAKAGALLNALPVEKALRAFGELYPFGYNLNGASLFNHGNLNLLERLHGEGKDWAIEQAEKLAKEPARLASAVPLRLFTFTTLVRAQVPIEPQWDALLVIGWPHDAELLRAIPESRRAVAVISALQTREHPANGIKPALELLENFPLPEVVTAVVAQLPKAGEFPGKAEVAPRLRALAKKHTALQDAVRAAIGEEPKVVELTCLWAMRPEAIAALSSAQQAQIRVVGDSSSLELRAVGDASGKPVYDALLHAGAATIFKTGTTDVVGKFVSGAWQLNDVPLRDALDKVLRAPMTLTPAPKLEPKPEPIPEPKPAPKVEARPPSKPALKAVPPPVEEKKEEPAPKSKAKAAKAPKAEKAEKPKAEKPDKKAAEKPAKKEAAEKPAAKKPAASKAKKK